MTPAKPTTFSLAVTEAGLTHAALEAAKTALAAVALDDKGYPISQDTREKVWTAAQAVREALKAREAFSAKAKADLAEAEALEEAPQDIHKQTASLVFGVPPEAVTPEQRSAMKHINLGIPGVHFIHDEVVYDVPELSAKSVHAAQALLYAEAGPLTMPLSAEPAPMTTWHGETITGRILPPPGVKFLRDPKPSAAEQAAFDAWAADGAPGAASTIEAIDYAGLETRIVADMLQGAKHEVHHTDVSTWVGYGGPDGWATIPEASTDVDHDAPELPKDPTDVLHDGRPSWD